MFPTEKKNKKALFNRIFSIAGLSIGGAILAGLIVYVARTMDVRALLASIQPLWLLGAALCVPLSESVDALIFYGMGRSAGCPVKLAGCFDAAYIGEFYYKLGPAGAPVQLKLMYDAGMFVELTALFAIPFFLYRGLGLTGGSFWELVLVQCLVLVLSRIIMLPGNAGGAEGSFYLFMGPLFGRHLAVGLVLWRFAAFLEVLLLGGAWSVLRFAQRSAAGHGT